MPQTQRLIALADKVDITEAYGDWLGLIKNSMLQGSMRIEKPNPLSKRPCQILITTPAIHPNGDILACACRNIYNDPDMYLGNILETDLGTALDKIKNIARNWCNGKIPQTCYRCTMYGDPSYYWWGYFRRLLLKTIGYLFDRRLKVSQ
jgi:radical SAM protein with 4Fe4S-binding SPASM domain